MWAEQLLTPSPETVHIKLCDVTLLGENWMHQCNQILQVVHPTIRAVRFRYGGGAGFVPRVLGKANSYPRRVRHKKN